MSNFSLVSIILGANYTPWGRCKFYKLWSTGRSNESLELFNREWIWSINKNTIRWLRILLTWCTYQILVSLIWNIQVSSLCVLSPWISRLLNLIRTDFVKIRSSYIFFSIFIIITVVPATCSGVVRLHRWWSVFRPMKLLLFHWFVWSWRTRLMLVIVNRLQLLVSRVKCFSWRKP